MKKIFYIGWILLAACLLPLSVWAEPDYAGINVADAPEVQEPMELLVRDGSNYIKFASKNLPATVTYIPDSAFGPLPTLVVDGTDMPEATQIFSDCKMQWQWIIESYAEMRVVNIIAHEDATISVLPRPCETVYSDTIAEECTGVEWYGTWYDESGDYSVSLINADGCDSIHTLHLTVYAPQNTDTTAVEWDSIAWYGTFYTESGEYSIQKYDEHGCDYMHTLFLTIHTTDRDTVYLNGCDSLIYLEQKYTESGIFILDTTYTEEENRVIHYLNLAIGLTLRDEVEEEDLCGSYKAPSGTEYTESGVYSDTTYQEDGCMSIVTLRLLFKEDCTIYDTVYFCEGQNTEHLERWDNIHATRFIPYIYESPAEWDYMEGVILSQEHDRALVDLARAEQNLYAHYIDSLTSVKSIVWSYRLHGTSAYNIIEVQDEPQWIETGVVALTVRFVCGQMYTTDFATDIESMNDGQVVSEKMLQNGQVVILRNGIKYNLLGTKIE